MGSFYQRLTCSNISFQTLYEHHSYIKIYCYVHVVMMSITVEGCYMSKDLTSMCIVLAIGLSHVSLVNIQRLP